MTFDEFVKEYCWMCATQRCDPKDEDWREGCPKFKKLKSEIEFIPTEEKK